jgi:sugar (pentulose or hexulose) kinase
MQLRADVLGRPVEATSLQHATAVGAALIASVGCGSTASFVEAGSILSARVRVWEPDPARVSQYDEVYRRVYRHIASTLRTLGRRLAEFSDRE